MPTSLIRLPEVQRRTGASRAEIYKRMGEGTFPRPVKISPRMVAWVEEEIDKYVADVIATRERGGGAEKAGGPKRQKVGQL